MKDHAETTRFFHPKTGELYEPTVAPQVAGLGEDGDEHESDG